MTEEQPTYTVNDAKIQELEIVPIRAIDARIKPFAQRLDAVEHDIEHVMRPPQRTTRPPWPRPALRADDV